MSFVLVLVFILLVVGAIVMGVREDRKRKEDNDDKSK
jgi:hypothetical protein